jgi:beta-lactamase class D/catechol 2,3-dioxygenase-like lactoylglutathione lyase family enzyme
MLALLSSPLAATDAAAEPTCTLIVDAATGAVQLRAGDRCDERLTPASTFKVPLALIGFDSKILIDRDRPAWPFREGYADWDPIWKRTTTPTTWMRDSVVWYSQELTRRLGIEQFQKYVDRLEYGNRDLSGDPGRGNGLTNAWLGTSLRISATEQVAFIRRLIRRELPVSRSATARTMGIMPEKIVDGWRIKGKTGTGSRRLADGTNDRSRQVGWFVGWATHGERTLVFARLIEDEQTERVRAGWRARDTLFADWPALMAPTSSSSSSAPIVGLDHIPLVVRDLAAATETYRRLGFSLKPGRPHENGITNAHVKFPDGSGVELITAPAGVDELTRKYRMLMEAGEGPVFFSLHVRQDGALTAALDRAGIQHAEGSIPGLTRLVNPGLASLFFVQDNRSPTDRPEHFAHPNGAVALARVWWASADPLPMRRLLEALGGVTTTAAVAAPARVEGTVVRVENGEVVIVPASNQVMPDRPIAGVTFHVRSLEATAKYFAHAGVRVDVTPDAFGAKRVLVAPSEARGLYLEFRAAARP